MAEQGLSEAIAAVIRGEAAAQKLGVPALAKAAGVPYPTLARYLADERAITIAAVEKIAPALGRSVAWIVERAEARRGDALAEYVRSLGGDDQTVSEASRAVTRPAPGDHGRAVGRIVKAE